MVKPLTQSQFVEFVGDGPSSFHREIAWFSSDDGTHLGAVIYDLKEKDFGWVLFGRDDDRHFTAIDMAASHASAGDAQAELVLRLRASP